MTSQREKEEEKRTAARCLIWSVRWRGCRRNGCHGHHGSATLRGGRSGRHSGTTDRCWRKGFRIGGLATLWCEALWLGAFGIGGGRGSGFALGLLSADDPPRAGRLGSDFVGFDFLWIHIPYD